MNQSILHFVTPILPDVNKASIIGKPLFVKNV